MFEVHEGRWGYIEGDNYELISSTKVSEWSSEEAAWAEVKRLCLADRSLMGELLVKKPEMTNNRHGFPSRWADEPEGFYDDIYREGM